MDFETQKEDVKSLTLQKEDALSEIEVLKEQMAEIQCEAEKACKEKAAENLKLISHMETLQEQMQAKVLEVAEKHSGKSIEK